MRGARLALGFVALFTPTLALAQTPPAPPAAPPAAAAATPAATAPSATGAADYFPLKTGARWTYKVNEITIVVKAGAADADGTKLETLVGDKVVASEVVKVTADSVTRVKINDAPITPPVQILKLTGGKPVKGDKWMVDSKIRGADVKGEFVIKDDADVVKVAGADVKCVCVEGADFDIAQTKTAVKYWFAPGKGVVKLSYSIQGVEAVLELKEYTDK